MILKALLLKMEISIILEYVKIQNFNIKKIKKEKVIIENKY
jgi:hypothetical protein